MIQLSDHFTYKRLAKFVISPIFMMIFISVYSVVDGLFVSNFVGQQTFTAVNLIFPYIMILGAVGFMFGTGGTAIVSKTMGEGDNELANKYFTLIVTVAGLIGVSFAVAGIAAIRPVAKLLGADDEILPLCVTYGSVILCALPFFMLQNMFQSFLTTAEKPKLGFLFTIASGITNIVSDALFVVGFKWGLVGAAIATAASQTVGGVAPLIYFVCKNSSKLRLCKFGWNGRVILKTCTNGASELLGNIALSLVSMLYNRQLLRLVGNYGVDTYGVICYIQFVFVAIFIGYCIGTTPIVGYNFGAQNRKELQNVFSKSLIIVAASSVAMTVSSVLLSRPLANLFLGYNQEVCEMTVRANRIFSLCYLFVGFNMFASCFFTALNNGLVSAILSFARTLVFQLACIYVLPLFWGLDGIWISTTVAEALSLVLTVVMFAVNNKKYGYIKSRRNSQQQNVVH